MIQSRVAQGALSLPLLTYHSSQCLVQFKSTKIPQLYLYFYTFVLSVFFTSLLDFMYLKNPQSPRNSRNWKQLRASQETLRYAFKIQFLATESQHNLWNLMIQLKLIQFLFCCLSVQEYGDVARGDRYWIFYWTLNNAKKHSIQFF